MQRKISTKNYVLHTYHPNIKNYIVTEIFFSCKNFLNTIFIIIITDVFIFQIILIKIPIFHCESIFKYSHYPINI